MLGPAAQRLKREAEALEGEPYTALASLYLELKEKGGQEPLHAGHTHASCISSTSHTNTNFEQGGSLSENVLRPAAWRDCHSPLQQQKRRTLESFIKHSVTLTHLRRWRLASRWWRHTEIVERGRLGHLRRGALGGHLGPRLVPHVRRHIPLRSCNRRR